MKLEPVNEDDQNFIFWCPGCDMPHEIWTKDAKRCKTQKNDKGWQFNGNHDKPTFAPSYLTSAENFRCHSFITDGNIQFLDDCTHKLKGQTVPLPDVPD